MKFCLSCLQPHWCYSSPKDQSLYSLYTAWPSSYPHLHYFLIIFMFVVPMQLNCMQNKDSGLNKYWLPLTYLFSKCFHYLCVNLGNVRLNKIQSQPSKISLSRMVQSCQNWVKQPQRPLRRIRIRVYSRWMQAFRSSPESLAEAVSGTNHTAKEYLLSTHHGHDMRSLI